MDIRNFRKKLGAKNEYVAAILNKQSEERVAEAEQRSEDLAVEVVNFAVQYTNEQTVKIRPDNIIYVCKQGDDENNGKHPDESVATINKALELVPIGGIVEVIDRGPYEEDLILNTRVILKAPHTTLIGTITLTDCAQVFLDRHVAGDSGSVGDNYVMLRNVGCTGRSLYKCNFMVATGAPNDDNEPTQDYVTCIKNGAEKM